MTRPLYIDLNVNIHFKVSYDWRGRARIDDMVPVTFCQLPVSCHDVAGQDIGSLDGHYNPWFRLVRDEQRYQITVRQRNKKSHQ